MNIFYVHVHQKCLKCGGCKLECEHRIKTTITTTDGPMVFYQANRLPQVPEGEA